jgi:uncharacterized protein YodC (DUF2158 family)
MTDPFAPGDLVQLKSGGPPMTVDDVKDGRAECVWADGHRPQRQWYSFAALKEAEPGLADLITHTLEAAMLSAIVETFERATALHAAISDITVRFNELTGDELGRPMTNKWVGGFVRRVLKLTTAKSHGVYVVPQAERPRVDVLAQRFGIAKAQV